jgi:putative peptidoglycan lipid II flippase
MFLRSAFVVSLSTLVSRVFGYIRDVIIAAKLGTGIYNDIFIIAFRIPNLFRTIFGEGAFSASFIPIYSGLLETEGKDSAQRFAAHVHSFLFISVLLFCGVIFIIMPWLIRLTAPGIKDIEMINLAVALSRITIFYLILISFVAFYGGILNAIGKYFPFAAVPIILNICLIGFASIGDYTEDSIYWLSFGIVLGGILELLWMLYFLKKFGFLVLFSKIKFGHNLKLLMKRLCPGIIGSGVAQINILVDTVIASFVLNGISYLYYADRIHQLPLALLGTTMGIVILPMLSKSFKRGDQVSGIKLHNQAMDFLLFISIPSAFALGVLAFEIVEVLFERGEFNHVSTVETAKALVALSIGLPAYTLVKIFVVNFHANGDTQTPVKIALVCIIINAVVSILLLNTLKHVGIALASSISAWINICSLWYFLQKKKWFKLQNHMIYKLVIYIVSSVFMVLGLAFVKYNFSYLNVYFLTIILVSAGFVLYIVPVFLFRALTIKEIKAYLTISKA